MREPTVRILGRQALQAGINGLAQAPARARFLTPQVGFEFAEGLLGRIEVGSVPL